MRGFSFAPQPANNGIEATAKSATILQTFFFTAVLLLVSVVAELHARRWKRQDQASHPGSPF